MSKIGEKFRNFIDRHDRNLPFAAIGAILIAYGGMLVAGEAMSGIQASEISAGIGETAAKVAAGIGSVAVGALMIKKTAETK